MGENDEEIDMVVAVFTMLRRVKELSLQETVSVELFELITRLGAMAECTLNQVAAYGLTARNVGVESVAYSMETILEHASNHLIGELHD